MHRLTKFLTTFLAVSAFAASCLAAVPKPPTMFKWPDPATHQTVILAADQNIEDTMVSHPEWFKDEGFVGYLAMTNGHTPESDLARQNYIALRYFLGSYKMFAGTYVSGTTVSPDASLILYPDETVRLEQMPGTVHYLGPWTRQPVQQVVDLRDAAARKSLQSGISILWHRYPSSIRYVDNAAIHPAIAQLLPWDVYCKNIADLRRIGEGRHDHLIFNVFMHVGKLNDQEIAQLIQAVGKQAISLELPWAKPIRESKEESDKAAARYRQLLDSGMAIILVPRDTPVNKLIDWVATWRKPDDKLYLARSFDDPPSNPW